MKVIPIIVLLLVTFAYAGNVYVCEYEYQADLCVRSNMSIRLTFAH